MKFILESEPEPDKYNNIKSVDDLIEAQMEELGSIFKSNINVSSIIFITQSALVCPDYQSKKFDLERMEENKIIFEWINRYFYLLNDKKLIWICGDFFLARTCTGFHTASHTCSSTRLPVSGNRIASDC